MQESFSALGVSASVVRALERRGITAPFAVQQLVLPDALAGVDVLAASPTGSGKTLAFGIPLVERVAGANGRPAALVLVPTRELASQVVADISPIAEARSLRIAAVYGGTSVGVQAKRARGAQILVATPGRLRDLIERRLVSLLGVRVLVLDEADPHAGYGLQAAGRPRPARRPGEPPDAALLRHPRRRSHGARPPLHRQRSARSSRAPR
jgi:superfamily II DNA/RNA helicase